MLVAAVCVPDEIRADTAQIGIAGFAAVILPDEYDIVIRVTLIKPSCVDTKINQFIVDTSVVQIFDGVGGTAVCLW